MFDPSRYPPDWPSIRLQIKHQANDRCEFCGVPNRAWGARDCLGRWHSEVEINEMPSYTANALFPAGPHFFRIVLTVAHLCHDTMCRDPTDLRALCQRCHLNYDRPRHIAKARATIRRKRLARTGQLEMAL